MAIGGVLVADGSVGVALCDEEDEWTGAIQGACDGSDSAGSPEYATVAARRTATIGSAYFLYLFITPLNRTVVPPSQAAQARIGMLAPSAPMSLNHGIPSAFLNVRPRNLHTPASCHCPTCRAPWDTFAPARPTVGRSERQLLPLLAKGFERTRRQAAVERERHLQQERIELSQTIHDTTAQTTYASFERQTSTFSPIGQAAL